MKRLSEILKQSKKDFIPWLFEAKLPEKTATYFGRSNSVSKERETELHTRADRLLKAMKPAKGSEVIADALLAVISELKMYGENLI